MIETVFTNGFWVVKPGREDEFVCRRAGARELSGAEPLALEVDRCEDEVGGPAEAERREAVAFPRLAGRLVDLQDAQAHQQVGPSAAVTRAHTRRSVRPETRSHPMEQTPRRGERNVEPIAHHAERPGFRIAELQIGPTEQVPWHSHSHVGDTFYVLEGRIRVSLRDPTESIELDPGQSWGPVEAGRAHRVKNAAATTATFLVLHGIGEFDFVTVPE